MHDRSENGVNDPPEKLRPDKEPPRAWFLEEIEQLKKEKEWLKCKVLEASQKKHIGLSHDEKIKLLEDDMQQALKEE